MTGAQGAIEEVQKDDDAMSLMYLSNLETDPKSYYAKVRYPVLAHPSITSRAPRSCHPLHF